MLQWPLEMQYMDTYPGVGAYPGHYGIIIATIIHVMVICWLYVCDDASFTAPLPLPFPLSEALIVYMM